MTLATKTRWALEGDYLQSCNCDYGCPCEFEAPPTEGFCEGVGVWKITKGSYGTVDLTGLAFGFAAYWPKAIHEGNGTVQLVFDEKAKPEQRDALMQITSGQAGGMPFELIVQTFSKVMEPAYVKAEFELNGSIAKARMGDFIAVSTEAIKNPVTKQPESLRVVHETGFLFKEAAVVAGTCSTKGAGLNFSHPDKAGFIAKFKYGN